MKLADRLPKEKLHHLYWTKEMSYAEIGELHDVSRSTVHQLAKRYKMKSRTRSEARQLALKKGKIPGHTYHGDFHDFFDEWSPKMAYVLGFVYADGHLRYEQLERRVFKRLEMSSANYQHLRKIADLMGYQGDFQYSIQNGGHELWRLRADQSALIDRLIELGVPHDNKSLTATWPQIPAGYLRHFIRGYFDGDGAIMKSGRGLTVFFGCGSRDFIDGLRLALHKHAGTQPRKLYKRDKSKDPSSYGHNFYYTLRYTKQSDVVKFYHFVYDGVSNAMLMSRKKDRFDKHPWIQESILQPRLNI